jgi:putative endonuclease
VSSQYFRYENSPSATGPNSRRLSSKLPKKKRPAIKTRSYRYERAEVDIIAQKNRLLVFIEIKARNNDQFGRTQKRL